MLNLPFTYILGHTHTNFSTPLGPHP
jgi:hypothetical protein